MSFIVHPSKWERDHAPGVLAGVAYQAETGELPTSPVWNRLWHRHEIDPERFARYHPNIAIMFDRSEEARAEARAEHQDFPGRFPDGSTVAEPLAAWLFMVGVVVAYFLFR